MKESMRTKLNMAFSAFLVIAYIVCSFYFSSLAKQVGGDAGNLIQVLIFVVFGLLLFYATRVGEGKQVRRFSIFVLVLLVLPCAYIIAASFLSGLPFHDQLVPVAAQVNPSTTNDFPPVILMLACIGLGYGVPYTFLSGYELKSYDEEPKAEAKEEENTEADAPVEGGIAAELAETAAEEAAEKAEEAQEAAEKAEEAAEAVAEKAEETAEKAEEAAKE